MLASILLDIYTMLNMNKNREEIKRIILKRAKELLKKDKEDLGVYDYTTTKKWKATQLDNLQKIYPN